MINASVAPLNREVRRQRKRLAAVEKRVDGVEDDVKSALQIGDLVQRVIGEGMGRIELKLDKQHGEIVQRLDAAEGWIGRRRRWEKTALRVSQLAVVGALRRWLPFVLVYMVLVVAWLAMVKVAGG